MCCFFSVHCFSNFQAKAITVKVSLSFIIITISLCFGLFFSIHSLWSVASTHDFYCRKKNTVKKKHMTHKMVEIYNEAHQNSLCNNFLVADDLQWNGVEKKKREIESVLFRCDRLFNGSAASKNSVYTCKTFIEITEPNGMVLHSNHRAAYNAKMAGWSPIFLYFK